MTTIPFARPYINEATQERIEKRIHEMLADTQKGGKISNGENVRALEKKVAEISGAEDAIACSSCTQAMAIALGASGVRGTCWTQSFTWDSTAVAANLAGASEVKFLEIDPERWAVKEYYARASGQEQGFTLAVDTFGAQFEPISYLPVFYDRAHSLGVKFRHIGLASILSFSPSKIITGGEGGMILCNRPKFAEAMRNARDLISRMTEANAIIALENLWHLDMMLAWKKETYEMYRNALPQLQFQVGDGNHQVIGALFPNKELRDKVMNTLKDDIEFKAYYKPLHLRNKQSPAMPTTEDIYNRILCLPSWYGVERTFVIDAITDVINKELK